MLISRDDALKLLDSLVTNNNLKKHMYCVEASMRFYAKKYNQDENLWGLAGLLHDADWEKYPDVHPKEIVRQLKEKGINEELVHAIAAHGNNSDQYGHDRFETRESLIDKALFACDEISGFVVAASLVRPDKLTGLTATSVMKKIKDKAFAANVSREDIIQGAEELGIPLEEHVSNIIEAITGIRDVLGL